MWSIGPLSEATGCNIETIRYYEKIELLPEPSRTSGGHRLYKPVHKERLLFIRRARDLGFSIEEVREFIALSDNESRSCGEALEMVQCHLDSVREKQARLQQVEAALLRMAESCKRCCSGAKAPDCTIVKALAGDGSTMPGEVVNCCSNRGAQP